VLLAIAQRLAILGTFITSESAAKVSNDWYVPPLCSSLLTTIGVIASFRERFSLRKVSGLVE
jgi:hypothetical protein